MNIVNDEKNSILGCCAADGSRQRQGAGGIGTDNGTDERNCEGEEVHDNPASGYGHLTVQGDFAYYVDKKAIKYVRGVAVGADVEYQFNKLLGVSLGAYYMQEGGKLDNYHAVLYYIVRGRHAATGSEWCSGLFYSHCR